MVKQMQLHRIKSLNNLLADNDSRNYRHITDDSVDTNVVSFLLTAVAFLCFHTYYVRCRQCATCQIQQLFSKHFHFITHWHGSARVF